MQYASFYVSSNGQPVNGYATHTSKRAAIARARQLKANLILNSGGHATAIALDGGETREDTTVYDWYEHINGGYCTAL